MSFLLHLVVTSLLLLLISNIVKGIEIDNWVSALIAALVLGIINAVVKPIAMFFSLPLTILTLGLFVFVVNAIMLWLAAAIGPGFKIKGFGPAFLGALLLSVLNWLVGVTF